MHLVGARSFGSKLKYFAVCSTLVFFLTIIFFHCYAAIYLKDSDTKQMVWRKFGQKLFIGEFILGPIS